MLRLMIVDDEQIIREALSEMVDYQSIGYELVATAKNGMEALDTIRDEYPDVVVTDIRMPFINGLELIDRSRKSDSNITFVLLSGYGEFEYAKEAMKYGVRHYLLKPTDKRELIETLIAIRQERLSEEEKRISERSQLLCSLQTSLEQCFLMEALTYEEDFSAVYKKYLPLLSSYLDCQTACVCSFVEEAYMKNFASDSRRLLELEQTPLCFSCIYIKNNMILIFHAPSLAYQERIRALLGNLHYFGQTVAFELQFLHAASSQELFHSILLKISRFQQIFLVDAESHTYEIRNDLTAPWRISHLNASLTNASDEYQAVRVLNAVFHDTMPTDTAKNLALSLFLKRWPESGTLPTELACDFFQKLYGCLSIQEIQNLMGAVLLRGNEGSQEEKNSANIALLKSYVNQHLDSETLSLKWLAENYLFISIGYLSKLFIKEEGLRFSDYLNKRRVEEAKRLMEVYQKENVKNIAGKVGFGSNPQYFSQVFKRYTGLTPTEYMEGRRLP